MKTLLAIGPMPMKTPKQVAATSIWSATSSQLYGKGGVHCDISVAVPANSKEMLGVRPVSD
jgi:hypothetical protein